MSAVAAPQITTHRLYRGTHEGVDPETGKNRRYKAGVPGHDIVKDKIDLSARWPERFERVMEGQMLPVNVNPATMIREGETLNQFAARMADLAKTMTSDPTVQIAASGVSSQGSVPAPQTEQNTASITPDAWKTLQAMSAKDLISHCNAEEINIGNATKKDEILAILKTAFKL